MPNQYFRFKTFTVHQEHCAMKVTTEGSLFGAIIAEAFRNSPVTRALDIGSGTGLLSLLVARQCPAFIDAVEIDAAAAEQAAANFAASPWANRLQVHHLNITAFNPGHTYPLIFTNPPFFEGDLRSADVSKNAAKHDTTLSLPVLFDHVKKLLDAEGHFIVLLPTHRVPDALLAAGKNGMQLYRRTNLRQTPAHEAFRAILFFSTIKSSVTTDELLIREENGNYSESFIALLKDDYLNL